MIITEATDLTATAPCKSLRVLLLDPALESLVASVCAKHQWTSRVIGERWDTVLRDHRRPKLLLLGFTPTDERSLELLHDLRAACPGVPVAAVIGDSLVDAAVAVSGTGGRAL